MSADVFRSHLSIEAEVVRGLLEAHGLPARVSSTLAPGVFPLRFGGQAEFSVSVADGQAERAKALIAGHLDEAAAAEVRRLGADMGPLQDRIGYCSTRGGCRADCGGYPRRELLPLLVS